MTKATVQCPGCGSDYIARMIYGMRRYESVRFSDEPVVYGGKEATENSSRWECRECGKQFGRLPVWSAGEKKITPEDLVRIEFMIGGCFSGYDTVVIRRDGENMALCVSHMPNYGVPVYVREYSGREWDALMKLMFEKVYVQDWKREYTDNLVLDGTQWSLVMTFIGGLSLEFSGSNDYPTLWETFQKQFAKYVAEGRKWRAKPEDILKFYSRYRDETIGRGWFEANRKELEKIEK